MRVCHSRAQNSSIVLNKFFLVQTFIITFIYLLAIFIVQNVKKILKQWIHSYEDVPFWAQNGPFTPIFFWKIIKIIFIYLLAPFIVKHFKKFFHQILSY